MATMIMLSGIAVPVAFAGGGGSNGGGDGSSGNGEDRDIATRSPIFRLKHYRAMLLDKASGGRNGGIRARFAGNRHHDNNNNNHNNNNDAAIVVVLHIPMHPTRASGEPSIGRRPSAGGVSATTSMTTIPMMMTTTPIGLHD